MIKEWFERKPRKKTNNPSGKVYCQQCYEFHNWDDVKKRDIAECGHKDNVIRHNEDSALECKKWKTYKESFLELNSDNHCPNYRGR